MTVPPPYTESRSVFDAPVRFDPPSPMSYRVDAYREAIGLYVELVNRLESSEEDTDADEAEISVRMIANWLLGEDR